MEIKASIKNALTTPQKARLVLDTVRGKSVAEAEGILRFSNKKASGIVQRLIESGVANAVHNYGISKDNLFIKSIQANEGLVLKRWMPRAHGHANKILKKRSHILLCLEEIEKPKEERTGRKSKIQTVSYEEVKKAMEEAQKASKMVAGAKKDSGKKDKEGVSSKVSKDSKDFGKKTQEKAKLGRLGDSFKGIKGLLRRTAKKG